MSKKGTYTTAEPLEWHEAISFMNRLYEDPSLGSSLSAAALLTVQERYSNAAIIRRWRQVYLSPEDYIE